VRPDRQRQGIGPALVRDFEERVREPGAIMIWLGTDDVDAQTSLSGIELYPDVLGHATRIRNSAVTPTSSTGSSASPWSMSCRTPAGLAAPTPSWPSE